MTSIRRQPLVTPCALSHIWFLAFDWVGAGHVPLGGTAGQREQSFFWPFRAMSGRELNAKNALINYMTWHHVSHWECWRGGCRKIGNDSGIGRANTNRRARLSRDDDFSAEVTTVTGCQIREVGNNLNNPHCWGNLSSFGLGIAVGRREGSGSHLIADGECWALKYFIFMALISCVAASSCQYPVCTSLNFKGSKRSSHPQIKHINLIFRFSADVSSSNKRERYMSLFVWVWNDILMPRYIFIVVAAVCRHHRPGVLRPHVLWRKDSVGEQERAGNALWQHVKSIYFDMKHINLYLIHFFLSNFAEGEGVKSFPWL